MTYDFDAWRARSPYYDETHDALAESVRTFVTREIEPNIDQWEADRELPRDLHRKAAEAGILGLNYPEEYGGHSEGFDIFHGMVVSNELARVGAGGLGASLMTHGIGLPPILALGTEEMKQAIAPPVLAGDKIIALGITEPSGGSDVANLKTRAVRDGDDYVVNGQKMFITSGMRCDYMTTAVRTGGEGAGGVSLLLIEMDREGVERTPLEKMGWHCSDTAAIYFDDVRVPAANLIGGENSGFMGIMRNFNRERLGMAMSCCSFARVCLIEAADWARERKTFGKPLAGHQVIRVKLADMARRIGTTQAWVDQCAWAESKGVGQPADFAMLKVQATEMLERVARDAAQILGGASYLQGSKVERIYREVRVNAIGGGSEEIMLDLAGRQLFSR
ncbi:acyl-CoA dehydrogenase [Parasphingopyxis sp. CP4]|uniref:acyl-CoA dehydrogenase family protein n=1 Tax=Parasphingopyxis sp. CP4 TaxID=2724527 RepID=UPI0015A431E9|nr:acyl-CoA dehydrogenase family protein [Parasphingopyxis sp. CP4]QLC22064.1 acyl-CoA dehydrogenase [Parasphingopyxis sp. CP4]